MLPVAGALAGNVQVLLLDEPFEGLSPAVTQELFEVFDRLRQEIALIIVDHHLDLALGLSDRTVVLERGTVTWNGVSTLLRDDLDLRRKVLWLGTGLQAYLSCWARCPLSRAKRTWLSRRKMSASDPKRT